MGAAEEFQLLPSGWDCPPWRLGVHWSSWVERSRPPIPSKLCSEGRRGGKRRNQRWVVQPSKWAAPNALKDNQLKTVVSCTQAELCQLLLPRKGEYPQFLSWSSRDLTPRDCLFHICWRRSLPSFADVLGYVLPLLFLCFQTLLTGYKSKCAHLQIWGYISEFYLPIYLSIDLLFFISHTQMYTLLFLLWCTKALACTTCCSTLHGVYVLTCLIVSSRL